MARRWLHVAVMGLAAGLLLGAAPTGKAPALKGAVTGNPKLQSIDVISFGPQGLLLIGDGRGKQLVAVDTGDTTPRGALKTGIDRIDEKLANKVGTDAKGIKIGHVAVNPASGVAYVALQRLDNKSHMILTVDGSGKIGDFVLENVKYVSIGLPTGDKAPVDLVTDVAWAEESVLMAGRAEEEFASKIFSIPTPLTHQTQATISSTETYHVAHGRWETKAPMQTILPYEENGKKYLVGAFTCTPLVKYPLDEIKLGAKVKGTSMVELGQGNQPQDMFIYEKDGRSYVLVNTVRRFGKPFGPSQYWTARVDLDLLRQNDKVNEQATRRVDAQTQPITDRIKMVDSYHGVVHMDRLDKDHALVLREDGNKGFKLEPLLLP